MEVAGEIGIFESQKACAPLRKHLFGARRFLPWLLVLVYMAALLAGSSLADWLVPGTGLLGLLVVAIPAVLLWGKICGRMAPKAWMARGVPMQAMTTYRADETGLTIVWPHYETRLAWAGVSQIAPGHKSWLFIGPVQAFFLPVRFFADPAAETAFLRACFDRLDPAAKTRSKDLAARLG
ncbi:YcxB family protein [Caulobacter zeae]|nr:YcxB family protein [Caulobacter zeae]